MEPALVSIVTPFYNAAPWLAECIRSVLAQTYQRWEYILLDNASTDGSSEIARQFAAGDTRIRYVRNAELLNQVRNYNTGLAMISPDSHYCKIVQADDWIFPDCVRAMVEVFETSERVGLVCSYYLKGSVVQAAGLEYSQGSLPGRPMVRQMLRDGMFLFGSPTAHMFRSSIVRSRQPFYPEGRYHEDTDACVEILTDWDFGYIRQVLSFLRTDNASIMSRVKSFEPQYLDGYTSACRHGPVFFEPREAASLRQNVKDAYYSFLAGAAIRMRPHAFWEYHRNGLRTVGEDVEWLFLLTRIGRKLAWSIMNPGSAIEKMRKPSKPMDVRD